MFASLEDWTPDEYEALIAKLKQELAAEREKQTAAERAYMQRIAELSGELAEVQADLTERTGHLAAAQESRARLYAVIESASRDVPGAACMTDADRVEALGKALGEARAEIERLRHEAGERCTAYFEALDENRSEREAIIALRDLPPGAAAPEHEGEAYAVAAAFRTDAQALGRRFEREAETARARVAELEAVLRNVAPVAAIEAGAAALGRAAGEGSK